MTRIALVAAPLALPDLHPAPGSLDADVVRARLPLEDAGFRVVDLDAAVDLAEQIDLLFDRGTIPRDAEVLFYVSGTALLSVDGELFLTLDAENPETGDSLRDLAAEFCDRAAGRVAFVLECRHAPDEEDPFRSAAVAGAAKEAVVAAGAGIELLVAATPFAAKDGDDRTSPLTRALIEALDEADAGGLTLARFYEEVRESPAILGVVPCLAHTRGRGAFDLVPAREAGAPRAEPEPTEEPAEDEAITAEDEALTQEEIAEVLEAHREEGAVAPPLEPAPARGSMASIPVDMDDEPELPPPAPPPARPPPPEPEAKVILAAPPSKPGSVAPPPPPSKPTSAAPPPAPSRPASVAPPAGPPAAPVTAVEHMAAGDARRLAGDQEGALAAYKRALGLLGSGAAQERAEIYVRQGQAKQALGLRREAIAAFEKALSLAPQKELPAHLLALEALLALNVAEADWRAVAATEERVLATLTSDDDRFAHLKLFGARWQDTAGDAERARAALSRARELRPDDLAVLGRLRPLYEQAGMDAEALAARRRVAELTRDPRERARLFFELGQHYLFDLRREEVGLPLLDKALESDPTMLEPLAVVARVLADRQEWSELEQAYRRMLDRVDHTPEGPVRAEVTWELCRRLGFMFRDHLDDPGLALDALEDAVHAKPLDLQTRLTAAELARSLGKNDRAAVHLEAAAGIDPGRAATYHDLFESFQKLRRPDQAYQAAAVTMHLRQADTRERFIFEEHKPHGVPKPAFALRAEAWEWLRPHDRDTRAEAVLRAVTPAAIAARLAQLGSEGRLPSLDPAGKQDPEKSTVSIVRSFAWASHYLAVPAPAVYLSDDPGLALASVVAEEATVFAGQKVLRGRSLTELAFLVGRHLAYHVGGHRLVLYYPSIEELTAVFLAAVRLVLPEVPAPATLRAAVAETERGIALRLTESARVDLAAAVAAFESGGSRAHIAEWVASVERCATRAGFLLAGDLEIAAGVLRGEGRGVLEPEAKLADLLSFAVSDEHRALREALGIAIQP